MRRARFMLLALLLAAPACHPPPTIVTVQGQRAYTADQVVMRVNELQDVFIAANTLHSVDTPTTRKVVNFCVAADRTLGALPNGWQASLLAGWLSLKQDLPPITDPAVLSAIALADAAIKGVQP